MKKSELRQIIREEIEKASINKKNNMGNFDLRNFLYNNPLLKEDDKTDLEKSYKKDVRSFRADLSKYINMPKVKAVLDAGLNDGDPDDDKLPFTPTKIAVKKLTPTQSEIGFDQSVKGNLDDEYGSLDGILKGNVNVGGPIVTYAGKYIIDGHHRWSTVFAANPGASMDALDIAPKPGFQPLDVLKAVHSAVAIDRNKVPSADPQGRNILDGSMKYEDVLAKVKEIFAVTDKGEKVWKSFFEKQNIPYSPELVAKHLYNNLNQIVKNGHIAGAPGRKDMPQTDVDKTKSIDKLEPLAKGKINIAKPFEENLKKSKLRQIIREEIEKSFDQKEDIKVVWTKDPARFFEKGLADGFDFINGKKVKNIIGYYTPEDDMVIGYLYARKGDIERYSEDQIDAAFTSQLYSSFLNKESKGKTNVKTLKQKIKEEIEKTDIQINKFKTKNTMKKSELRQLIREEIEKSLNEASLLNWIKKKFKETPNVAKANKLKRDWLGRFGVAQEEDFNKLIDEKGNISKKDYLNLMRKHYDFGDNDPQTEERIYTPWIKYFNPNLQDEIDNLPDRYF